DAEKVVYSAEAALIVKNTWLEFGSFNVSVTPVRSRLDAPGTGVLVVPSAAVMIRLLSIVKLALPTTTDWYAGPFIATCDAVKTTGIDVVPTTTVSFIGFGVVLRKIVSVPLAWEFPIDAVAMA